MNAAQVIEATLPITDEDEYELVKGSDPRAGIISVNPERMSGTPSFAGTRVPVKHLWDYLESGESLDEFLEGFPGVSREQAITTLELAFQRLMEGLPNPC